MTKLAAVQDVKDSIRFGSVEELNAGIDSALEVATSSLETDLRNESFTRTTRYDLFFVKHRRIASTLFEYHWRMSHGFIDSGATFTIKVADQIDDFAGTNFSDITSEVIIDYARGVASVVAGQLSTIRVASNNSRIIGNFVRIDYTSGFNSDDNTGFFDADEVPAWLKEAAIMKAVNTLDIIDPSLRSQGDNTMSPKHTGLLYQNIIQKNIRYFPKHDLPVLKS